MHEHYNICAVIYDQSKYFIEAVEKYVFLADAADDDSEMFEDAVKDIFKDTVTVNKAKDGKELMEILNNSSSM